MHVCPIEFVDWEPNSHYEEWVSAVVSRNPDLRKCLLVCGPLQCHSVALFMAEQMILVHIENTICDRCGVSSGPCAVPDFGAGNDDYREFVFRQPPQPCPACGKMLFRRRVLRRLA